ncbi:hypothetical protein HMPREF3039_02859 [Akkermansia sp. KLE1798]|nr:hypothetical protein HMPREF3039_02859 [Akkermansia sp. KLE1798]
MFLMIFGRKYFPRFFRMSAPSLIYLKAFPGNNTRLTARDGLPGIPHG